MSSGSCGVARLPRTDQTDTVENGDSSVVGGSGTILGSRRYWPSGSGRTLTTRAALELISMLSFNTSTGSWPSPPTARSTADSEAARGVKAVPQGPPSLTTSEPGLAPEFPDAEPITQSERYRPDHRVRVTGEYAPPGPSMMPVVGGYLSCLPRLVVGCSVWSSRFVSAPPIRDLARRRLPVEQPLLLLRGLRCRSWVATRASSAGTN